MPSVKLYPGDNRQTLRALIEQGIQVHSVVTDPPYGLVSIQKRFGKQGYKAPRTEGNDGSFARLSGGFMGKKWDATEIERDPEFWKLIYDILLPGGFVFAFSGSRTGHWQAVAMEMAGFIMHPMHGWVYGCMDPSTQCLTRRGWLFYTDLLPTDEVMQWDSISDTLSWVVPEHIHEYDFDGEMVQIENRHTHQVLTPNHRVYCKVRRHSRHPKADSYEVLEARDIHERPGNWRVDLPMASTLHQSECNVDPSFAYLVGWWLTDAWPHRDANACCFSQSKPVTLAKLRATLAGLGVSEYVKSAKKDAHNDEHTFYLSGPMADRLRAEFPDRKLGWEVLDWQLEARKALYEGLMDGDGSRDKPGQVAEAFWSQQQDRRDVFVALALSIGIRCYEDPVKGVVYVNRKTQTTQVQSKHRSETLRYEGKVWCLTVPTGAFVVRRSGRPFITGNSGFPKGHAIKVEGFEGWSHGTQTQKPALEPIYLGQKPFSERTGDKNVARHGVGAFNIDGCRVPGQPPKACKGTGWAAQNAKNAEQGFRPSNYYEDQTGVDYKPSDQGRYPSNLILDGSDEVVAMFPAKAGAAAPVKGTEPSAVTDEIYGKFKGRVPGTFFNDEGSAARFFHHFPPDMNPVFYQAKATKADRAGGRHPTVKPIALMQYLIRHITPPGGVVLDPFAGSGTTAEAAKREGFDCILMEAEPEYVDFLDSRFSNREDLVYTNEAEDDDLGLLLDADTLVIDSDDLGDDIDLDGIDLEDIDTDLDLDISLDILDDECVVDVALESEEDLISLDDV